MKAELGKGLHFQPRDLRWITKITGVPLGAGQDAIRPDVLHLSNHRRGLERLRTAGDDPVKQADQLLTSLVQQHASDISAAKDQILNAKGRADALSAFMGVFQPINDQFLAQTPRTVDDIIGKAGVAQQLKETGAYPAPADTMNWLQQRIDKLAVALGVIKPGEHVNAGIINTAVPNADNTGGANEVDWAGIFKLMKNGEQLDGVNGHEMGHGLHRDDLRGAVAQAIFQQMGLTFNPDKPAPAAKQTLSQIANGGRYSDDQLRDKDLLWNAASQDRSLNQGVVQQLKMQTVASAHQQTIEWAADTGGGATALHGVGESPAAMSEGLLNLPDAPTDPKTTFLMNILNDHGSNVDRATNINGFIKQMGWAAPPTSADDAYAQMFASFPDSQTGGKQSMKRHPAGGVT